MGVGLRLAGVGTLNFPAPHAFRVQTRLSAVLGTDIPNILSPWMLRDYSVVRFAVSDIQVRIHISLNTVACFRIPTRR